MEDLINNIIKHHRYPLVHTGKIRQLAPVLDSITVNGATETVYRVTTEAQFVETYHGKNSTVWYSISSTYSHI